MTHQLPELELERAPLRGARGGRRGFPRSGRVVVDWSSLLDESWVEAVSVARCTEVVLTARLGADGAAKHRVLALAELLTQRLAATKSHIRVRFLPLSP